MIDTNRKNALPGTGCSHLAKTALAIAMAGLALSAQAGKITSVPSASDAPGFGGWNLDNVDVVLNGTQGTIGSDTGSWFDPATGAYQFAADSDFSYESRVFDDASTLTDSTVMGLVQAKDWPIGEPSGIKIVNDDPGVKDKPANCIMATSYLKDHYLDSADPQQVICSSPFQTHKRFKVAMLPSTVDGGDSDSVDLVFNVEAEAGSRDYQVFQKINNWTDGRLQGFKVEVGFGVGQSFVPVNSSGVDLNNLNIAVPSDLWSPTQLATFSAGLFGPLDKHTGELGFFDQETRAGFYIDEYVTGDQPLTDTLTATTPLPSDYANVPAGAGAAPNNQFGPWLPNSMLPTGIFFDDDGNPDTDAALIAWYGYNPAISALGWMGGAPDFQAISADDIGDWGTNLSYTSGVIDDLVNVGINYIVRVGDVTDFPGGTFTIRVTPTADTSETGAPSFDGVTPDPVLVYASSEATVELQPRPEFLVGSLLTARVGDADLNNDIATAETVVVAIASSSGLSDTLTLVEQGENRGVFAAILPEAYSDVPAGTTVTLSYLDASEGETTTSMTTAEAPPAPILSEMSITELEVPESVVDGKKATLSVKIVNDKSAEESATGTLLLTGSDGSTFTATFTNLAPGKKREFKFKWTADLADPKVSETVEWVASVTVTVNDNDQLVDEATATTLVTVKQPKRANR